MCDGELARHLNLQSARLTTYDLARKEAITSEPSRRGRRLDARILWTCHRSARAKLAQVHGSVSTETGKFRSAVH